MEKVKRFLEAGVSLQGAVKEALGCSIAEFAARRGRNPHVMSSILNGKRAPNEQDVEALVAELGGTAAEWRYLLWQAARPADVPQHAVS